MQLYSPLTFLLAFSIICRFSDCRSKLFSPHPFRLALSFVPAACRWKRVCTTGHPGKCGAVDCPPAVARKAPASGLKLEPTSRPRKWGTRGWPGPARGSNAGGARGSRHVLLIRKARPSAPLPDFHTMARRCAGVAVATHVASPTGRRAEGAPPRSSAAQRRYGRERKDLTGRGDLETAPHHPPLIGFISLIMSKRIAGPEIERLIQLLAKVPGLGPRSARRAALHLNQEEGAAARAARRRHGRSR